MTNSRISYLRERPAENQDIVDRRRPFPEFRRYVCDGTGEPEKNRPEHECGVPDDIRGQPEKLRRQEIVAVGLGPKKPPSDAEPFQRDDGDASGHDEGVEGSDPAPEKLAAPGADFRRRRIVRCEWGRHRV